MSKTGTGMACKINPVKFNALCGSHVVLVNSGTHAYVLMQV